MKVCWNWLLISLFTDKTLANYNTEIYKSTAIANRQFKWSFFKKAHKSWPKTIFVCASDISENLGSILISIFYDKSTFHKQKIKIKKKKEKKTENTFKFLNVEIMVNICKFQEYLGNSRKFISQYKEPKFACISLFVVNIVSLTKYVELNSLKFSLLFIMHTINLVEKVYIMEVDY